MSCDPDKKQSATDSLNLPLKIDSVLKKDTSIPQSDSVLPFEQDTQKIMETLDLLDSIRQAKYN